MEQAEKPGAFIVAMPLDFDPPRSMIPRHTGNSAPVQLPQAGSKSLKNNQVAPTAMKPMKLNARPQFPFAPTLNSQQTSSMGDPLDSATERSKAFNILFGLFFASGGLYFGYAVGILGSLGERWLRFNFGITDDAAMFLGLANL